ncbi:coiled-coil domain-containing protein 86 [Topomyia yanbarensis]|uniref:coiled-coil domain-containing protein 86 n=1 Tax=Topomyia yanbarensis TaxID=2498891 RepID=UPI00273B4C85|nr:coiled-coil domain-containing protein 86 [Topomyia yanbarensis]
MCSSWNCFTMENKEEPDISSVLSKILSSTVVKSNSIKQENSNSNMLVGKIASNIKIKQIKPEHYIPRGRPKSGRIWKTQKEKFSTVKKSIRGKATAKHLAYREEIKQIKELSRSIKEERKQHNQEKRQRQEENKRRRLENERKSEIVQIIKNPAKLKRLRKKQLRQIEKRDFDKIKIV